MPDTTTLQAERLAPDSVSDYRNRFEAEGCTEGEWSITQFTTWIARNGEDDGEAVGIEYGLTEADARAAADRLNAEEVVRRAERALAFARAA